MGARNKFNVWCEGDSSVGLAGARATVIMDARADDIEDIKECLKEAFENIWNDDVKVMTEDDIARTWRQTRCNPVRPGPPVDAAPRPRQGPDRSSRKRRNS